MPDPHYRITVTAELDLNESEMRALDAIASYNVREFLDMFYAHMGKHYLTPHEHGLRTLWDKIRAKLTPALGACDRARKAAAAETVLQKEQ
jgi:hypothetical protein